MTHAIRDEVIEELLQGYSSPADLLGEEGLFKQLKKRLLERALGAELSEHLGYEKGAAPVAAAATVATAIRARP
jgi:putative transposase